MISFLILWYYFYVYPEWFLIPYGIVLIVMVLINFYFYAKRGS